VSQKIDLETAPVTTGSRYPAPYDQPCHARYRTRLGDAAGLTQFGVNRLTLPPETWSSQRHWHTAEDEFIYVLEGEVVLVTNDGEQTLRAGDSAGFKSGVADGHQLQNRSTQPAVVLEIGARRPEDDEVDYPDIDLRVPRGRKGFTHKDGTRY
jgi:uncharacterized cupin superfamily protein